VFDRLFKNLPEKDSAIDYPEQTELLQICNLALLDEVKRLENEMREIKRPLNIDLMTNPADPYFLNSNSLGQHVPVHMFGFEEKGLSSMLGQMQGVTRKEEPQSETRRAERPDRQILDEDQPQTEDNMATFGDGHRFDPDQSSYS